MIIVSIKSGDNGVSRVEFSDGSLFSFKDCYFSPYTADSYVDGSEINAEEEEALRFASTCLRAEKAALRLIARAEQNVFGLSGKLEKRGHTSDCVRAVISWLCESGLLDDRRYARLWLESRICRQAASPRRLLAALRSRSIDRHDAEAALKETLDDEAERQLLERYVQKLRRKGIKNANVNDRGVINAHALRYTLKSEGFSNLAIQFLFEHYPDTTLPEF